MDRSSDNVVTLSGMYKEYFLDYASYVILERAVPNINDGLKPVQRRILHSMKMMDDGRFHKVANIIGQTMQYHPHGDAAIGDALVNLGQKDLLIDCQGNWGDIRTGDSAAASRYIEARLTKFALDVVFNPQTTDWQVTYDGRKKEPITLPVKFPLVLSQGVEGIAVGLSTKILPHNFVELIKASIKILEGKKVKVYPDFQNGGQIDVSDYKGGKRGGKVKVRAKIIQIDKNTLAIKELPYGITTNSIIESILKANEKGQIKIKKVIDNTAKDVEIQLELMSGVSPELTIDALYAFTNCETSISPNACVIIDNKPHFLEVNDMLETSTMRTKELLRQELEIRKGELEEKWHNASLEKIFIENRIYRDIEECETWDAVIEAIDLGLRKYVATPVDNLGASETRIMLMRDITKDDIVRLTEIKIKRISKYNSFKADETIHQIEEDLKEVKHHLQYLTEYAIDYFRKLLEKYGKGKERRTEITSFEKVEVQLVAANNAKLYVDRKEGFIGMGMKKDEFVCDCSDIADVIAFTKEGSFKVVRVSDKAFIGKNIIHVNVWDKGDERTTYNVIYLDGKSGRAMAKRFHVSAITRDKEYFVTKGTPGSKVLYFTANPNGESETVQVQLSPGCKAKKKLFDFDLEDIGIKGRSAGGNILTKYPVRKISQIAVGKSSLGAMKIWMDKVSGRLNTEERGKYLGAFDTGNQVISIYKDGTYEINDLDQNKKYEVDKIVYIHKFDPLKPICAIYFEGEKSWTMVKRFLIETSSNDQRFSFISDASGSKLYYATQSEGPKIIYSFKRGGKKEEESLDIESFIDVKGWKALGNKLIEFKILKVTEESVAKSLEDNSSNVAITDEKLHEEKDSLPKETSKPVNEPKPSEKKNDKDDPDDDDSKYHPGDTIELDF